MKFGFIYRFPSEERGLFYNGEPANLKYCYNPQEAQERYDEHKGMYTTIQLERPGAKSVKVSFPFGEGVGTHNLELWANGNKRIDARLLALIDDFSKKYLITEDGYFVENQSTQMNVDDNMSALQMMKDVLLGVVRITPLKVFAGLDRKTKEKIFIDYELGQDTEIEYEYKGRKQKTKIFGAYAPKIREAVSDDSIRFDGYTMQARQRHYNFYRGQFTAIHACRGSGKTISETPDSLIYAFKEETYDYEKVNGIVQHFFSGTIAMVKGGPYKYVKRAMNRLFRNTEKKARKLDKHELKFYVFDGDEYSDGGDKERSILFGSAMSEDKGRGQRPAKTKLDEAAWYDNINGPDVFGIALGTNYNEVTLLTTINYQEPKNWEYDVYMRFRSEMKKNEDLVDLIVRLRKKYGFDKAESRADYQRMIDDGTFKRAREEFHSKYKYAALKYTIEDVDEKVISKDKKVEQVNAALQKGEQFMLAEYYSEYIDAYPEFNAAGLVEQDTPNKFEEVIVGFDEGGGYDNPAIVVGGISNKKLYIKYSERLPRDIAEKWKGVRNVMDIARRRSQNGRVKFICTATGGNAFSAYKEALEAVGQVNMLLKETPAKENTAKEFYSVPAGNGLPWHHRVGKRYMVKITREQFFNKGNIVIDSSIEGEKGLLDELENYKNVNGTYKAAKGKDDQVAAMMFVCLYAYTQVLGKSYDAEDLRGEDMQKQFREMWKQINETEKKKENQVEIDAMALYVESRL